MRSCAFLRDGSAPRAAWTGRLWTIPRMSIRRRKFHLAFGSRVRNCLRRVFETWEAIGMEGTGTGTKYVYDFTEGHRDLKDLLGGKGANLAEMTNLGLPVP